MRSLSCHQSCAWIDYVSDNHASYLVSSPTALAFLTNMSEKCKSTSPSAVHIKVSERQSLLKRN